MRTTRSEWQVNREIMRGNNTMCHKCEEKRVNADIEYFKSEAKSLRLLCWFIIVLFVVILVFAR